MYDTLKRYKEELELGFKLYAYCIMNNHIHLLLEVEKAPLGKTMQRVQQVYTKKYNKKNNRTGHVFGQRYKAVLCNKDAYLLHLTSSPHVL
ncbi:MAG: transposase [Alkaliphilus sp.]